MNIMTFTKLGAIIMDCIKELNFTQSRIQANLMTRIKEIPSVIEESVPFEMRKINDIIYI